MDQVTSTDGTTIAFTRQGTGDPLLLVHGTTASAASWALVVPLLLERFTVVAMDRRGRGASGDGEDYSLDLEADDLAAVIDAIGEPVHLVGHSFGARVALLVAARSDRLRSLVIYEPPIAVQHGPADLADRAEALMRDGDRDAAAELFLTEAAASSAEEIAILRSLAPVWERITSGVPTAPREVRSLDSAPVDLDAVRRIDVPVLVLVGEKTTAPVYLDGLDEIERALPDAKRATIPGQGHLAPGFAPEAFADAVASFLTSVAKV